jgi:hypothetical protein
LSSHRSCGVNCSSKQSAIVLAFSNGWNFIPKGQWIAVGAPDPSLFVRSFAMGHIAWGVTSELAICYPHRSSPLLRVMRLFSSESLTLLVDSLYAEAMEAVNSCAALSASTPELISILGDIRLRALWRVNLMLALKRSLLDSEYMLMNVQKALASIISMCNLHVILLSKNTPRYFTLFTNGIFRPINVRRESDEVEVTLRPTVSRPVILGVRPPSGTRDQFFFRQLRVCYFVAPSMTRGQVCILLLLLVLASAVTPSTRPACNVPARTTQQTPSSLLWDMTVKPLASNGCHTFASRSLLCTRRMSQYYLLKMLVEKSVSTYLPTSVTSNKLRRHLRE